MLRYFIENDSIQQIRSICNLLNQTKRRLKAGDFSNPCKEYDSCNDLFESVLQIAIKDNDEKLANAQYVFRQYFLLFCNLIKYFELLNRKKYKPSWDKLQDCIDGAQYIGRFADDSVIANLN